MATAVERPSGFYSQVKQSSNYSTRQTYSIAHSAKCKLNLAANRPDRNLRFVLGHAFTLDKVLLRIVEIENESAKDSFDNSKPSEPRRSEIEEEDATRDCMGGGATVSVGETDSLDRPRRISFSNQSKPSDIIGGNGQKGRAKSPPPQKKNIPKGYEDDESTDSDDYDDYDEEPADFARALDPKSAINPPAGEQEDDDDGLGLTRFASASAQQPRKHSPSPPPLSESDSDEDEEPPKSPRSFPEDVVREVLVEGEEATELRGIYQTIKGCPCNKDHKLAPDSLGIWEIKNEEKDGRNVRYGVVKV
jgi:hypothetical protein